MPLAPLIQKLARRAKCGDKLAKKAQLFTLELYKFPPSPAATSNQARDWSMGVAHCKDAAMTLNHYQCLNAKSERTTITIPFVCFCSPSKNQITHTHTNTLKKIIIIIDSTFTARWSNEWSTIKLCVSRALFAPSMMKNAQSLISFLQTRKLMIITTWRNLL